MKDIVPIDLRHGPATLRPSSHRSMNHGRVAASPFGGTSTKHAMSRRTVIGIATLAALAAAWYLATMPLGLISPGRFPSPADVWFSLRQVRSEERRGGKE